MKQSPKKYREAATATRRRIAERKDSGMRQQDTYEADEKVERDALVKMLKGSHDEARKQGARRTASKASEKGMNAGTYGGSRSAFGSARSGWLKTIFG